MLNIKLLPIFAFALAQSYRARATGINCKGSSVCSIITWSDNTIGTIDVFSTFLQQAIDDGYGNHTYYSGMQIACYSSRCAFYEAGAEGTIEEAAQHLSNLKKFGCEHCGSDPTEEDGEVENGRLTVNYVDQGTFKCGNEGLCN